MQKAENQKGYPKIYWKFDKFTPFLSLPLSLSFSPSLSWELLHKKLTIDGNFAMNGNFHGNLDLIGCCDVAMVVRSCGKDAISGSLHASGMQLPLTQLIMTS